MCGESKRESLFATLFGLCGGELSESATVSFSEISSAKSFVLDFLLAFISADLRRAKGERGRDRSIASISIPKRKK